MGMALCELETTFPVKFLEKWSASGYTMIIANVFESMFEGVGRDVKLEVSDNGCGRQAARLMVSGDVEDNLTFIANGQLGWTTGPHFIERCIPLFEISKCSFRNVGDLADFGEGMSPTMDQPQGPASSLRGPLKSLHDMFDQLPKN